MKFAVDNRHFHATIVKIEDSKTSYNNEPAYIKHFGSIFEGLWKGGTDAVERIRDIEEGVALTDIEVIKNSVRSSETLLESCKKCHHRNIDNISFESMVFIRQEKRGAIELSKE